MIFLLWSKSRGSPLGGPGGILFLDASTKIEIAFAPGQGTNEKEELSSLGSVL